MIKIHRLAAVSSIAVASLFVAGCASSGPSDSDDAASATPQSATIAFPDGGVSIDPPDALGQTADSLVLAAYDTLVTYATEDGAMVPGQYNPSLAESWEVSEDQLTWTFHLRDDVTFQNSGNPMTADDVVWTIMRKPEDTYFVLSKLREVVAIDDTTVEFRVNTPSPNLLDYIGMYSWSISDSVLLQSMDDPDTWLDTNTAGTGPYVIESWDPSTEARLVAWEDYWGEPAGIANITLRFIPEMATQIQQLTQNDVQLITNVPPQNIDDLTEADGVTVLESDAGNTAWLSLNNTVEPLNDPRVRQALAWATPYDEIVENVLQGHGQPLRSALSPITPYNDPSTWTYDFEPDEAETLLEEAGYPDGFEFTAIVSNASEIQNNAAVIMQDAFSDIGVTMNISSLTPAQVSEQRMEADAYFGSWLSFVNLPQYHLGFLLDSEGSANYAHYSNPAVDEIIRTAEFLPEDEQAAAWSDAQAMMAEDVPWIYLYSVYATTATNEAISGYNSYVDQLVRFHELRYQE